MHTDVSRSAGRPAAPGAIHPSGCRRCGGCPVSGWRDSRQDGPLTKSSFVMHTPTPPRSFDDAPSTANHIRDAPSSRRPEQPSLADAGPLALHWRGIDQCESLVRASASSAPNHPVSPRTPSSARSSPRLRRDSIASAVTSIRRLVRVLRLNAQRTHAIAGISAAQLFVLQQLRIDDRLSLTELATRTLTDRSSVTDVVDRLETEGLVARTADPSDRRRASVRITPKGRRMLSRAPDAPTTALVAALHALTPRERQSLARSLARLIQALGAADEPATMLFTEPDETTRPSRRTRRAKRIS